MSDPVYELWVRTKAEKPEVWEQRELPEDTAHFDVVAMAEKLLDEYDLVRVEAIRDGDEGEYDKHFTFWYAAFTDPLRGRQSVCDMTQSSAEAYIAKLKKDFECPIFSPNELFDMKPDHSDFDSYRIIRFLSPYLGRVYADDIDSDAVDKFKLLEERTLVCYVYDGGDASWSVGTLWYEGVPFAVVQRSGEDEEDCYITSLSVLSEVITWLLSFAKEECPRVINPNEKNWRLTEFCNRRLTEFYDVGTQKAIRCPECGGFREERLGVPPYGRTIRCKNTWHEQFKV